MIADAVEAKHVRGVAIVKADTEKLTTFMFLVPEKEADRITG